jgi:hypothetical protein
VIESDFHGFEGAKAVGSSGSPKDAQAQLRHSKLEMTGWYMKQIPETVRAAVEKMDADLCRAAEEASARSREPVQ